MAGTQLKVGGGVSGPEHFVRDGQAPAEEVVPSGGQVGHEGLVLTPELLSRLNPQGLQSVLVAYYQFAAAREERLAEEAGLAQSREVVEAESSGDESTHSVERSSVSSRRARRRARAAAARRQASQASFTPAQEETVDLCGLETLFVPSSRSRVVQLMGKRASFAALLAWPAEDFDTETPCTVVRASGGGYQLSSRSGVPVIECLASLVRVVARDTGQSFPDGSLGSRLEGVKFRQELLAKAPPLAAELQYLPLGLHGDGPGFCYRSVGVACGPWPTLQALEDSGVDLARLRVVNSSDDEGFSFFLHECKDGRPASDFPSVSVVGADFSGASSTDDGGVQRFASAVAATKFPVTPAVVPDDGSHVLYRFDAVPAVRSARVDVFSVVASGSVVGYLPYDPRVSVLTSVNVAIKVLSRNGIAFIPVSSPYPLPSGWVRERTSLSQLFRFGLDAMVVVRTNKYPPYAATLLAYIEILLSGCQDWPVELSAIFDHTQELSLGVKGIADGCSYAGAGVWLRKYGPVSQSSVDRMAVLYPVSAKPVPVAVVKDYGTRSSAGVSGNAFPGLADYVEGILEYW